MAESYLGEIRIFAGNFAPVGWAFCHGQLISIAENDNLFGLIGTTYGGDGQTTFALPDLRGRVPVHRASNSGPYTIGTSFGAESVALQVNQMPVHTHQVLAARAPANTRGTGKWAQDPAGVAAIYSTDPSSLVALSPQAITPAGGSQPHNNMMPFLGVNFIISLNGIYPSRS